MMRLLLFTAFFVLVTGSAEAQFSQVAEEPTYSTEKDYTHTQGLWLGTYTKYRLNEKTFYYGEYHYRRTNNFIDDMAQIYLRFGLTYLVNNRLELTAGVVTPIYWAPEQDLPNQDNVVPQYRLWQQVLLVQPFDRLKLYHTFRFEQRWRRDYVVDSPFELTHRFRYKITGYYPLNNYKLVNKTLFASFYEEIFIQAGKSITYNYFEDNRVFLGLGYILNENIQIQAGYMWTFRYNKGPSSFEHRHIPRLSIYHNLDFHRKRIERRKERVMILDEEF
jgi:hypothetical protein